MLIRQIKCFSFIALVFIAGSASIGQAINDDPALVLYLPFEEGKGDTTMDQSGNKIEGVLQNSAEWTRDGKIGNAISLKGNAYVEFPEVKALDITDKITIEGWIFPLNVQNDSNLFGRRTPANQGGYTMQWTQGKIETWVHIGSWQGTRDKQKIVPKPEEWHHVAGVYDGSFVRQYVDGELDVEFAQKGTMDSVAQVFRVGQAQTGLESMEGIMDEIAVYNRDLSADEIRSDMEKGVLFAVSPQGKLATTWGDLKKRHLHEAK